ATIYQRQQEQLFELKTDLMLVSRAVENIQKSDGQVSLPLATQQQHLQMRVDNLERAIANPPEIIVQARQGLYTLGEMAESKLPVADQAADMLIRLSANDTRVLNYVADDIFQSRPSQPVQLGLFDGTQDRQQLPSPQVPKADVPQVSQSNNGNGDRPSATAAPQALQPV
ncbi:hypothetical protein, partial [Streptococcus pseudopneumoniae]|uniref:hypothetical protein n=1 Tax=Streptococcus pseudopneumoniae TaxID=257758 RepID=UPI0014863F97